LESAAGNRQMERRRLLRLVGLAIVVVFTVVGCGPSAADLEAVDYTPVTRDEWQVSTPEQQGLDPERVAELYYNASELETIYSLLVLRRLRDLIPDIEYHELGGARHLAHYEFPERINPILIKFLTRPASEEAP